MPDSEVDVLVVGGGIAGLAAGCELLRAGLEVVVCEASGVPGGVIQTACESGYRFERGPNTFRVGPELAALMARHGAADPLVRAAPTSHERFLLREGRLVPVPLGPVALLTTPLLSARGKLRLLAEPFVRRGDAEGESVAAFVTRRLGGEACRALVGPFLVGVYAGDERRLGAESVFPSLVEHERRAGSIVLGALLAAFSRRSARGRPGIYSGAQGGASVVRPLAEALGPRLQLGRRVVRLAVDAGRWRLEVAGPDGDATLRARGLVVAAPAHEAAALVVDVDGEAARLLREVSYAPVATVALGADPAGARHPPRGFGFLVPGHDPEPLLGCLYMSQLFPGRAPAGRELLACMLGGLRVPEVLDLEPDVLGERACEAVASRLGLRGEVRALGVTRWRHAVPQPDVAHPRRMRSLRTRLAALPPAALAGAYVAGVSVSDSAASGVRAAGEVGARLRA